MAQNHFAWIVQRVSLIGCTAGLVAIALDGALPERMQAVILNAGIALTLVGVGAAVARPARDAHLQWRGVSPAAGIVVGLLAGLLPFILRGQWPHAERNTFAAIPTVNAPRKARPPIPEPPAAQPPTDASPPDGRRLEPLLAQIAGLIDQKARPALADQRRFLVAALQNRTPTPDPDTVTSQLVSNARELGDVESSLERIKSANQDWRKQLDAVIGDARPLTALNTSLRELSDAADGQGARPSGRGRLMQLATETMVANQWIDSVDRRLADARTVSRE